MKNLNILIVILVIFHNIQNIESNKDSLLKFTSSLINGPLWNPPILTSYNNFEISHNCCVSSGSVPHREIKFEVPEEKVYKLTLKFAIEDIGVYANPSIGVFLYNNSKNTNSKNQSRCDNMITYVPSDHFSTDGGPQVNLYVHLLPGYSYSLIVSYILTDMKSNRDVNYRNFFKKAGTIPFVFQLYSTDIYGHSNSDKNIHNTWIPGKPITKTTCNPTNSQSTFSYEKFLVSEDGYYDITFSYADSNYSHYYAALFDGDLGKSENRDLHVCNDSRLISVYENMIPRYAPRITYVFLQKNKEYSLAFSRTYIHSSVVTNSYYGINIEKSQVLFTDRLWRAPLFSANKSNCLLRNDSNQPLKFYKAVLFTAEYENYILDTQVGLKFFDTLAFLYKGDHTTVHSYDSVIDNNNGDTQQKQQQPKYACDDDFIQVIDTGDTACMFANNLVVGQQYTFIVTAYWSWGSGEKNSSFIFTKEAGPTLPGEPVVTTFDYTEFDLEEAFQPIEPINQQVTTNENENENQVLPENQATTGRKFVFHDPNQKNQGTAGPKIFAMVVAGCVGTILILAIGFFVYYKRKQNEPASYTRDFNDDEEELL